MMFPWYIAVAGFFVGLAMGIVLGGKYGQSWWRWLTIPPKPKVKPQAEGPVVRPASKIEPVYEIPPPSVTRAVGDYEMDTLAKASTGLPVRPKPRAVSLIPAQRRASTSTSQRKGKIPEPIPPPVDATDTVFFPDAAVSMLVPPHAPPGAGREECQLTVVDHELTPRRRDDLTRKYESGSHRRGEDPDDDGGFGKTR
jgi:hypothetical protein